MSLLAIVAGYAVKEAVADGRVSEEERRVIWCVANLGLLGSLGNSIGRDFDILTLGIGSSGYLGRVPTIVGRLQASI